MQLTQTESKMKDFCSMKMKIGFIGAGKLGTSLALAMSYSGYKINLINSNNSSSSNALSAFMPKSRATSVAQDIADRCELIFLTTPDDTLGAIVDSIKWNKKNMVVHCSGATSLSCLKPIEILGGKIGTFHPLQTFPQKNLPENILRGITFAIDSESSITELLKSIAIKLGSKAIILDPEDRALYHASATMVCGFITSIINLSIQLWKDFPGGTEGALESLEPLIQTTFNNVKQIGPAQAYTGPIIRGDIATISSHLEAIAPLKKEVQDIYTSLCNYGVEIGLETGKLNIVDAENIRSIISNYQKIENSRSSNPNKSNVRS